MTRGRLTGVLAMALCLGLGAPWPAFADPGDKVKPSDKNRKDPVPRNKNTSKYALFSKDADALRKIETEDMVEVARQIYQLDASATAAVKAAISKIQDARWTDSEEITAYRALLTSRANLCRKLIKVEEFEAGVPGVYRQLLKDKQFSSIQKKIRRFERQHPHRFCDYTDELESVLDDNTVQKAHQDWRKRCRLVSHNVRSRGLLSGLRIGPRGKRTTRSETKGQESKLRNRPKTKPRMGETPGGDEEKNKTSQARPPVKTQSTAPKESPRKKSTRPDKKSATKPEAAQQSRPLNEWDRHVRGFIQQHNLTMAQRHAALSILRALTFRADQIERTIRPRLVEARNISDEKARKQRIAALRRPIDDLFIQLQRRLDGLLTASQRSKATAQKR